MQLALSHGGGRRRSPTLRNGVHLFVLRQRIQSIRFLLRQAYRPYNASHERFEDLSTYGIRPEALHKKTNFLPVDEYWVCKLAKPYVPHVKLTNIQLARTLRC